MARGRFSTMVLATLCALLGGYQWNPAPTRVVVVGDSHSDADLSRGVYWNAFAPQDWSVNDQAVSGRDCTDVIPSALQRPYATQGEVLVIYCGTNDAGRDHWDVAVTAGWIERAVEHGLAAGQTVVVVVPPPAFRDRPVPHELRNERLAALRDAILEIAGRHPIEVVDMWAETWSQPDPRAMFQDELHFGTAGRHRTADLIEAAVAHSRAISVAATGSERAATSRDLAAARSEVAFR
jgi:lysophospholipase L1-like esterase